MKIILACFLAILIVGTTSAILFWKQKSPTVINDSDSNIKGRLEVQGFSDLGAVPIGTMATASLKISNRSGEDVLVNRFKPDCSCTEVYVDRDGSKERVAELLLKPNESEIVRVDLRISGEPGLKQLSSVEFQEANRPVFYRMQILHTPIARFYTVPRVLQFGDLRVDEKVAKRVELRSDGSFRRGLKNLTLLSTPIFSMRFTRATEEDLAADTLKGQELLGFVDFSFNPDGEEKDVREELTLLEDGEVLGKVMATAKIISDITIWPKTLVLPRYEGGVPVYSGWFHCRSRSGKLFEIVPDARSTEIRVSIDHPDGHSADSFKIGITFVGKPPDTLTRKSDLILKIKGESGERSLKSQVMIGPTDR